MNWNIFKKADVESKDRIKCSQCHVYLPENYLEPKCEYCLGIKTRKIKVHKPEPTAERHYTSTSDLQLKSGQCEKCGAVVPGLLSRYCINCYMVIRYG